MYEYGARTREVYFRQLAVGMISYTVSTHGGGQQLKVDAPYERMPLYIREGAIVPYGPGNAV